MTYHDDNKKQYLEIFLTGERIVGDDWLFR